MMIDNLFAGKPMIAGGTMMQEHIEEEGKLYGIPPYYYTQIQQQMLGLNAPFGYFATIFDKGWVYGAFKIFKDERVQQAIIEQSAEIWSMIKAVH